MKTKEDIIKIINEEDKRNPLTDEEISDICFIDRTTVTKIRKENHIPNSRQRKILELTKIIKDIKENEKDISNLELTRNLNKLGYKVGKYVVSEITKTFYFTDKEKKDFGNKLDIFRNFIGYDKSLKNCIDKLKAAIMYPPKGLHTIIYGDSGVGKSYLAKLAYDYALSTENFEKKAPYFEFNCADYAENPQLLVSQLFGHAKGSFTGADENKKGIVELCDGGILFLDEVHRLPSEGQEILFTLIDNGSFRRLGETETNRKSNLMIIAATTEDIDSSLLLTFRRRIPMNIKIPNLNERTIEEKIELIKYFLYNESTKLNKEIILKEDVLKAFLEISYPGNIGQLKSDIQVCCAKAFLNSKINNTAELKLKKEFIIDILSREKISLTIPNLLNEYRIIPNENNEWNFYSDDNENSDIYDRITKKYNEMIEHGINESKIVTKLFENDFQNEFFNDINAFHQKNVDYKELRQMVGKNLLDSIMQGYEFAKIHIPTLNSKIIFPLSIHLKSSIKRIEEGKYTSIPLTEDFKNNNKNEIKVSKKILNIINNNINTTLPDSEIIFITMFLNKFKNNSPDTPKIALLILSHGRVANGMAEVSNKILGENHAVGLEMDFNDSPEYMLEKTCNLVKRINQGKGCLILADMGSLLNFEHSIIEKTGIQVKIIGNVYTLMAIECLRKILYTSDSLEEIAYEFLT